MGAGGNVLGEPTKKISLSEVRKHNKASDGWVVLYGKVYDVSSYINQHPGGRVLLSALGEADSTDAFTAFHSRGTAHGLLSRYCVGTLEIGPEEKLVAKTAFEKEYRELGLTLKGEGMMDANPLYYAYKFVSTTAILVASAVLTSYSAQQGSVLGQLGGALLLALFWQQCGWLAHDFGHHQVFASRALNDAGILLVGNLYQGFSNEWWKNKHNTHHAVPNLLESSTGAHDGDPDIDTLPFLAWSKDMLAKAVAAAAGRLPPMLRYQALTYFPILFFARLTWALQSAQFVFRFNMGMFENNEGSVREKMAKEAAAGLAAAAAAGGKGGASQAALDAATAAAAAAAAAAAPMPLKYETAEKALILAHYAGVGALCFGLTSSIGVGLAHLVLAQTVCGLLLAVAFGVGHNGMAVFDPATRPAYGEMQVASTRNVDNDSLGLTGWFMGGLHVQIEHHLYPSVPRHNLERIRPRVEALCKRHGVPYHSTTLWTGTVEVLSHLEEVVKDFPSL